MKMIISTILALFLASPMLNAQGALGRTTATAVKQGKRASFAVTHAPVSRYNGTLGAFMGTNFYLTHTVEKQMAQATLATPSTTKKRSWLEQQQRDLKAGQLKRNRKKRDSNLLNEEKELIRRQAIKENFPRLNPQRSVKVQDFTTLIAEELPAEDLPLLDQPSVLYRGMALSADGKAIRNILQNGLLVTDTGIEANTRNYALSGGERGILLELIKHPMTNLTSFPLDAEKWAIKRLTPQKQLLVVIGVDGQSRAGKIVAVDVDIPAQNIIHFIVPLQLETVAQWCEIRLGENGTFLITPYQDASSSSNKK